MSSPFSFPLPSIKYYSLPAIIDFGHNAPLSRVMVGDAEYETDIGRSGGRDLRARWYMDQNCPHP